MTGLPLDEDDRIVRFPESGSLPVRLKGSMNPERIDLPSGPVGTKKRNEKRISGIIGIGKRR
jgi:hypothetical protein